MENEIIKKLLSLLKVKNSNKDNFLLLDGGGTKGIYTSKIISILGKVNYNKFNYLFGTSVGVLIILAYEILGFDNDINNLFQKLCYKIFDKSNFLKMINILKFGSIYDTNDSEKLYKQYFKDFKIKDLNKNKNFYFIITDFDNGNYKIINNQSGEYDELELWKVALYATSAPIYFSNKYNGYVDGAIAFNDPRSILNAIINKIKINKAVSIGFVYDVDKTIRNGKWLFSIKRILKLIEIMFNVDQNFNNDIYKNNHLPFLIVLSTS